MSWSKDYKKSIDCDNPSGFSQKAHCAARKKRQKGEKTISTSPFSEQMKSYKTPEQIAKKHRLEVSFIKNQLKIGEPIEHEHTNDHKLAMEIALQHLDEIPDYYTRLIKMEKDAKNQHQKKFKDRNVNEDLGDWFDPNHPDGGWKRYNTKGKAVGKCARNPGEPKPKCLSNKKASQLRSQGGAEAIASAVRRKRRKDPVANRRGKGGRPVMTSNKIKEDTDMIRYCPACNKNETQSECKYGSRFWSQYSLPTSLSTMSTNQMKFNIAQVHPTNEAKDHEYSMARSEIATIINAAKRLRKKVKGEGNIEAWVQSKITKAADYIDTAADYVDSGEHKVDEACWTGYKRKKGTKKFTPGSCVKEENKPTNPKLWAKWKTKAKAKFDVYPSAYANGWAVKGYKSEGGGWKSITEGEQIDEIAPLVIAGGLAAAAAAPYLAKRFLKPKVDKALDSATKNNRLPLATGGTQADLKRLTNSYNPQIKSFSEFMTEASAAWQRKEGKNPEGGLNKKGIASYRKENPGSKLSMAVTTPPSKLDPDSKSAKRRKSFCARMGGMPGPMKDEKGRPTRKALSLRKWNC